MLPEEIDSTANSLMELLRKTNTSAKHYFVNPPDEQSRRWRVGWVDDPADPSAGVFLQNKNPKKLMRILYNYINNK